MKHSCSDAIYGFGMIGALVYFLQHASNFMEVLIAIIKAVAWPAVLIYKVLTILAL